VSLPPFQLDEDCDQLRVSVERLRAMLEALVVRGLRACGADELAQLRSFADDLDRAGAGHVAAVLSDLHAQIGRADRAAPRTLLMAQTSVRLLERLLTLRVVTAAYRHALAAGESDDSEAAEADDDDGGE
jgi:hypothetical protein